MSEQHRIVLITPSFKFRLIEADHDDDKFVDCAFAANATYIVSDDKHFDVLKEISFPHLLVLKLKEFLGIPVDGPKSSMIQKLKAKGFRYNQRLDCLTGEFNSSKVNISIATNKNKFWRIVVMDDFVSDENDIKSDSTIYASNSKKTKNTHHHWVTI